VGCTMGRLTARTGVLTLAIAIGVTLAVPIAWAGAQSGSSGPSLVPATSWGLISVAQSSATDVMAVGYSKAPTTAPVGLLYNGVGWNVTPMPHPSGGALLYSVTNVPGTNDFIAGGETCNATACTQAYLLEWNGSSWTQMPLPALNGSTDIASVSASGPTDVWATGQTCNYVKYTCKILLLHWNGSAWSKTSLPASINDTYPDIYAVDDISPTDAWAVGENFLGSLALNWNGHKWSNVPSPGTDGFTEGFDAVSGIPTTSEIWTIESASGGQLMEKWNGTTWRGFSLPGFVSGGYSTDDYDGVGASSTTNAWVVGFGSSKTGTQPALTARWNGKSWSHVATPNTHPDDELFGVTAPSTTDAISVGVGFSELQPTAKGLVYTWSGTSWAQTKVPTPSVPSGTTEHAGRFTLADKY
jgi:hypothetical protein